MPDSTVTLYVLDATGTDGSIAAGTYDITGTTTITFSNNGHDNINDVPGGDLLDGQTFTISIPDKPQFDMNDGGTVPSGTGYVLYFTLADGTVLMGYGDADGPDNTLIDDTLFDEIDANGSGVTSVTTTGVSAGSINTWDTYYLNNDVINCFVKGTMITTSTGETAIDDLCVGDLVKTMDRGLQPLRWIGSSKRAATGTMAPVLIRKGTLGNTRDLSVSPQHRMLISDWRAELLFGETELLVPAISLVNDDTITRAIGGEVEYFHMLFDAHEIVFSEGCPSESFHPAQVTLGAMDQSSRDEILELFPELAQGKCGEPARKSLRPEEASLINPATI